MKRKMKSLSRKIVFLIAIVTIASILLIFSVFERINKEAFFNVEMEKAELVLSTIEPLIAVNMYLSLNSRIDQLTKQLITNPNILSVKVIQGDTLINQRKSKEFENEVVDSLVVKSDIFQPNSKKKIGTLILTYSNKNYNELVDRYTNLLIKVLFSLGIFFLLFSLYVKKLLSPLRVMAKLLMDYSPEKNIKIPFESQNNEIGFISGALNDMQQSIMQYSEQQKNINKYLEEKVDEKTKELRDQLYTNSLTGLPNRRSLLANVNEHKDGALLIINIDDFKEINDFYGQHVGDIVLIAFSKELSKLVKEEKDIHLAHLFGDEFALFFTQRPPKEKFISFGKKLIKDIEKMIFHHEENELTIRVTIGGTYHQTQEALEKADIALKSAKKQAKEFLLYYETSNVEEQYKNNMEWTKKLHWAIENDRIDTFFQPIFDNNTNKIVSAECLIRLIDENDRIVSPYFFLSIAKKSKLYSRLTEIMIEKSCKYFEHLDCDFSINLSVEDILDEKIVDYICQSIKKYNVGKKIVFELLETEGIENYEEVSHFIHEMKALGCRISIDDFGSGYSNFEYLLQLSVDYIKIDGSLIKNLDTDENAQVVVETIVNFAKKLNIIVIAEYVHNEGVYEKVKELNIDRSQGFFLAKPSDSVNL